MRILSLDLGIRSLGSCISDASNIIAIPLENFIFERGEFDIASKRVIEIVEEYNIGTILLGHPLRTDGLKSEATEMSESFFETLKKLLPNLKIKLYDERFTTQRGIELLKNKYKDPKKIHALKDMAAAYTILIDYLSYNNALEEEV